MSNAVFVLPYANGALQYPGVDPEAVSSIDFCQLSYAPAPYVLTELSAPSAIINGLKDEDNCLYLCDVVITIGSDGKPVKQHDPVNLVQSERAAVAQKVQSMGLPGTLNAAIQTAKSKKDLVMVLATKAMPYDANGTLMTAQQLLGEGLG